MTWCAGGFFLRVRAECIPASKILSHTCARVKCVMLGRLTRLRKCTYDDVFCVQASHFLKLQKQRKHGAATCDVHLFGCKTKADIMSEDMLCGLEDDGTLTKLFVAFHGYVTRVDMYSTSLRIYDEAESGYQKVTLMFGDSQCKSTQQCLKEM